MPYFIFSTLSLWVAHWLYKKGATRFRYAKHLSGAIIVHFTFVFTPLWFRICRQRSLHDQTVESLTLLDNGKAFCIYDLLGERRQFAISPRLFLDQSEVKNIQNVTKNQKYRPEFPSRTNNYSFMKKSLPGNDKEIMMLNELRNEFIDKEVLEAIKRGQEIDLS